MGKALQAMTAGVWATLVVAAVGTSPAFAQGKLEANYRVTLAGLTIGSGAWTVDISEDHYAMAASGRVTGIMAAFGDGDGTAAARGSFAGSRLAPQSYAIAIRTKKKTDSVRMALAGGAVRNLAIEPPLEPKPDRVPLTEAHKRGVLDPISAGIVPRGNGDGLGADACQRTLAVFDGRHRYDLALSYKRTDKVKVPKGYEGNAVVCRVMYQPVSGHEPGKASIKFLAETRDMEMWFAPVPGTRFLAMVRISIPTMMGTAVLEATRFNVEPKATQ